jgi:hypothetical protein
MAATRFGRALIAGLTAAALLTLSAPVEARPVTDPEKAALATTIADFNTATSNNDFAAVINALPPRIMAAMADQFKLSLEDMRKAATAQSAKVMATITLVSFGMDVTHATYAETADGTPYATIPTETVIAMGESKIRSSGDTLALLDEGKWYLLRVSEQSQTDLLKKVYPAFADVQFSPGTMEPVK